VSRIAAKDLQNTRRFYISVIFGL